MKTLLMILVTTLLLSWLKIIFYILNIAILIMALLKWLDILKKRKKYSKLKPMNNLKDYKYNSRPLYLDELIKAILNNKTTALIGGQGLGKSSLARQASKELTKKEYHIIEIKAWDYDQEINNPIQIILLKILESNLLQDNLRKKMEEAISIFNKPTLRDEYVVDKIVLIKNIISSIKFKNKEQKILFVIDELDRTEGRFASELIEAITLYFGVEESNDSQYKPDKKHHFFANNNIKILYIFHEDILLDNLPEFWRISKKNLSIDTNKEILLKHFNKNITVHPLSFKNLFNNFDSNIPNAYSEVYIHSNTRELSLKINENSKQINNIIQTSLSYPEKFLKLSKHLEIDSELTPIIDEAYQLRNQYNSLYDKVDETTEKLLTRITKYDSNDNLAFTEYKKQWETEMQKYDKLLLDVTLKKCKNLFTILCKQGTEPHPKLNAIMEYNKSLRWYIELNALVSHEKFIFANDLTDFCIDKLSEKENNGENYNIKITPGQILVEYSLSSAKRFNDFKTIVIPKKEKLESRIDTWLNQLEDDQINAIYGNNFTKVLQSKKPKIKHIKKTMLTSINSAINLIEETEDHNKIEKNKISDILLDKINNK